ncbi:uncharacterized protein LOC108665974 [Hyalella azteca]|uniref:Uncharacterized protein LOC108665974 n=1 Tax=Hyalella azteca TaxID=294128 RepID=A0A8B7N4J7_HYAAZ|nr:uncharacterized protein LOC108665974 [Hyalella azteca]
MGQLMSSIGCGDNKTEVKKLPASKNSFPEENDRPTSALTLVDLNQAELEKNFLRESSSANIKNRNINNNVDMGSAGSSGRGSKPPTPADGDKLYGNGAPISFISGRIPSAYDSIPSSDLGESLDVRRAARLFRNESQSLPNTTSDPTEEFKPNFDEENPPPGTASFFHTPHSACSGESSDSGISDPGEEYAFVITENSPPEVVKKVEEAFIPVENLNLIITGKACPRLLSGYQQTRVEEAAILESLRQEGFIATSKSKSAGGISFEVVEAAPGTVSVGSIKPENLVPIPAVRKMEARRARFGPGDRTQEELEERWSGAEQRRQAELDARKEKMAELIRKTEGEKEKMEQLAKRHETKTETAIANREVHLKELRDKLKAKNQHAQHVKLKKLINGPPVPVPLVRTVSDYGPDRVISNVDLFFK